MPFIARSLVRRPVPLVLAAALATGLVTAACAQSAAPGQPAAPAYAIPADATLLSVSAEAQAKRIPDVATVSAGVVTQAPDANAAMTQNAERMTKVVAAIKAAGIAERDVQTSGISLNADYQYGENQPPKLSGYQAQNTVSLKVRDIAKLGKVLDALVAQAANQINGPSFEVDQPDAAYDEARLAALKKAEARAKTYADAMGLRVRRIVSVSEGAGARPPMPYMAMARAEAAADTPVSPGETTLGATLEVVFELGR